MRESSNRWRDPAHVESAASAKIVNDTGKRALVQLQARSFAKRSRSVLSRRAGAGDLQNRSVRSDKKPEAASTARVLTSASCAHCNTCRAARRVYQGRATEGKQVVLQEDAAIYPRRAAGTVTAQAAERARIPSGGLSYGREGRPTSRLTTSA